MKNLLLGTCLVFFLSACTAGIDVGTNLTANSAIAYCEKYTIPEARKLAHLETQKKLILSGATVRLNPDPLFDCDGDLKPDYTIENYPE